MSPIEVFFIGVLSGIGMTVIGAILAGIVERDRDE